MHFQSSAAALAACLSLASAQAVRGFNSGSLNAAGGAKAQSDFQAEFSNQKQIQGTNGAFANTRLYTMIQGGTTNGVVSAIPAAIATNTGLLLGLWASGGAQNFDYEIQALKTAIQQYGTSLAPLVRGISVGSEDLYRISPTGIENNSDPGVGPDVLTNYIGMVRAAIEGTALANAPIGHVDTWNSWVNGSNSAVAAACDWVGLDEYPYYQSQDANPISEAGDLFYAAYDKTKTATGKPIWITETGWPTTGAKVGQAVASVQNAESYWNQVYCTIPDSVPVYWYIQVESDSPTAPNFGVVGDSLSTTPLYDLSCKAATTSSSSSSASATSTGAASAYPVASSKAASASTIKTSTKEAGPTAVVGPAGSSGSATAGSAALGSASATGSAKSAGSATKVASASAIAATSTGPSGLVRPTGTQSLHTPTSEKVAPAPLHSSTSGPVPYPVAGGASGHATSPTAAVGTGTAVAGGMATASSPSAYTGNDASSVHFSALALLAVPAVVALML